MRQRWAAKVMWSHTGSHATAASNAGPKERAAAPARGLWQVVRMQNPARVDAIFQGWAPTNCTTCFSLGIVARSWHKLKRVLQVVGFLAPRPIPTIVLTF